MNEEMKISNDIIFAWFSCMFHVIEFTELMKSFSFLLLVQVEEFVKLCMEKGIYDFDTAYM